MFRFRSTYLVGGFFILFAAGLGGCCTCDYATHGDGEGEAVKGKWEKKDDGEPRVRLLNHIQFDAGYLKSVSRYDADGNKQEFGNDQSETASYFQLTYRRPITRIELGGKSFTLGGLVRADYATKKREMAYGGMSTEQSGSGFRSASLEASFGSRHLFESRTGGRIIVGYDWNFAKEPDQNDPEALDYSSRQSAFYVGTVWDYWCHRWGLFLDGFYNFTTELDENGYTYDGGDYAGVSVGGKYRIRVSEGVSISPRVAVNYVVRTDTKSNGTALDNSGGYILGIEPSLLFNFRGTGLSAAVSYGYTDEFRGTKVGGINVAGKNFNKADLNGTLSIAYRF